MGIGRDSMYLLCAFVSRIIPNASFLLQKWDLRVQESCLTPKVVLRRLDIYLSAFYCGPNQALRTTKPLALKEALKVAPSNVNDYLDTFCGADLSVQKDKKAIGAERKLFHSSEMRKLFYS